MTGNWYGCATKAVACTCSASAPALSLSMAERRSEYTTPRSLSMIFGSKARFASRSASSSKMVSSAERGNHSI